MVGGRIIPGRWGGAGRPAACRDASFAITLTAGVTPDHAFLRVLDLRAHDRIIPFTRVSPAVPAEELRAGYRFVARTGIGVLGFDDPMRVESVSVHGPSEPATAVLVKEGRVIQGRVRLQITPMSGGSRLTWHQQVRLPWLPGFLQTPAARVLRFGYRRMLTRLLPGMGRAG